MSQTTDSNVIGTRRIVREQLEYHINNRFEDRYNPMLVVIDEGLHYPVSSEETYCGLEIPDPAEGIRANDFRGTSHIPCDECAPPTSNPSKRDLRARIEAIVDDRHTQGSGFNKDTLEAILEELEQ